VTVHERQVGGVTIIDMHGRITVQEGADVFRGVVRGLVALSRVDVILNFKDVPYIDSTALGELVRTHLSIARRKGRLTLLHLPARVRELLGTTRLLPVFEIFDDETEAVTSYERVRESSARRS
jgi:anti-anti-sigma factor